MNIKKDKPWHKVGAVADHYDVSVPTIWRWVDQGLIEPPVKLSPGTTRFPTKSLKRGAEDAA